jgi:hypothetical protein
LQVYFRPASTLACVLGRRLLVLMAVLLGLTALAAALAPRPRVTGPNATAPRASSPTPAPTPDPAAGSRRVVETLKADDGVRPATVRARLGDVVELTVEGDLLDSVELEGLNEIEPLEPGSPARFEVLAEAEGRFGVRLIDADRRIGRIDVRAR